ncbi:peroxiredoxin-like family protein [Bosea sp. 2KB_26]|uniref:peroxiredoxin-like family protein n=1 Tax=Bosea sp. 2KB_26 TaxID=3237475 RepID=UPI000DE371DE
MLAQADMVPLQPGDRAPNVVLDAITREGKIAIDDFRGQKPVLVGLYRGLHCAFCRRHIAAQAQLDPALRAAGVESLTVVNTPIERARLYFRYHPMPNLLAASDPKRTSHQAFGLPNLEFTENETAWPHKVSMAAVLGMRVEIPGETPGPLDPLAGSQFLDNKDGYELTEADLEMKATGLGQLVGQFLLDRQGIVRWCFTEVPEGGRYMFGAPNPQELMSAVSQVAQ